ncbi:MAG: RNA polymerase sigma factor [Cytophagaceae bacterium]|jgi:RNA polymerase sigma factor (sigma-70 family)|nr:RNA polymerase sigma factor [Cytophagaceae bacterium]
MANYTEKQILESIKKGADSSVFEYLYAKVYPKVKGYVLKNGGDLEESKDIFQDALLVFCNKVKNEQYEHSTEIDGFLYAVSRNIWINRFKIKIRKSELTLDDIHLRSDDDIEQVLIIKENRQKLKELFGILGAVCKELLVQVVFNKYTMNEISKRMGFANENVAKTKHYKCKQRLIQLLENKKDTIDLLR